MKSASHLVVVAALVVAPAMALGAEAPHHAFVGPKKCRMCHDTDQSGMQYTKWKEGPHAKAFATLTSDKAREFGKAKGIADPSKDAKCLKCHVTAYGLPAAIQGKKFAETDGVTCES